MRLAPGAKDRRWRTGPAQMSGVSIERRVILLFGDLNRPQDILESPVSDVVIVESESEP
jgi:hypothetical protein